MSRTGGQFISRETPKQPVNHAGEVERIGDFSESGGGGSWNTGPPSPAKRTTIYT